MTSYRRKPVSIPGHSYTAAHHRKIHRTSSSLGNAGLNPRGMSHAPCPGQVMMGDVSESFCVAVQTSDRQYGPLKVVAGRIPDTSSRRSPAILRKSHSTCSPCQNSSDCPKKAPNLIDMAGVIDRRPWTISLIARGETRSPAPSRSEKSPSALGIPPRVSRPA